MLVVQKSYVSEDDVKVKILNFIALKDWWMQLLLYLNEDFDDDLLSDAINLLPESL